MRESVRIDARKNVSSMSHEYVSNASERIESNLMSYLDERHLLVENETKVFIYNSYGKEVSTKHIIDSLLDRGVIVYLPIVRGMIMQAVRYTHNSEVVVGDFDIIEPVGAIYDGEFDISITPLLAYDRGLNRMGKGKGYYDRFFAGHIVHKIIGLGFKKQEVDSVFPEPHDIRLDVLVNEEEVLCE